MDEVREFFKSRKPLNTVIVVANIIIFLIMDFSGGAGDIDNMMRFGASYAPDIQTGEYYRLFTSMFLHFDIYHLFNNMLVLVFLGNMVEELTGSIKYLIIYLIGGIGGNILSYYVNIVKADFVISAGASGAVFAVVGALIYIVLRNRGRNMEVSGRNLAIMAGLTIFHGYTSVGVDNEAHIGGLVCGFILAVILYHPPKTGRNLYWK